MPGLRHEGNGKVCCVYEVAEVLVSNVVADAGDLLDSALLWLQCDDFDDRLDVHRVVVNCTKVHWL